jgi:hypothetical protein
MTRLDGLLMEDGLGRIEDPLILCDLNLRS